MTFLAPLMLAALALASAPIIIHLLNRRRFITVDWAPMHYLKLTLKTNRRRLRIEQLLLLAVRTLAVAALIFAMAQPIVSGEGFGGWLAGRGRTSRVIVIDDSLSMGLRSAGRSSLDRAKEAAAKLINQIGSGDSLTVLTTSLPAAMVREAHLDDRSPLLANIAALDVSDTASQWSAAFDAATGYLDSATFPIREVTLITDLRAEGWDGEVSETVARWAAQGVTLRIIDVGATAAGNVALVALEQQEPAAIVDARLPLLARIRNDSAAELAGAQMVLKVGDKSTSVLLPTVAPGQTADVPLTVTFAQPGRQIVQAILPDDSLPGDNRRLLAVDVKKTLEILLVDGEPGARAFESETDFLALAYSVGQTPWHVTKITDAEWLERPQVPPDVLVLANVAAISEKRLAEVAAMVESGMGLMIFMGEQVDPAAWNDRVYRDGRGLMPVQLSQIAEMTNPGLSVEPVADSPLLSLGRIAPEALARVAPRKIAEVKLPGVNDELRVLARWNDGPHSPAIIERRLGAGRVILFTITADRLWSDWPTDPTYVLAVRQAAMSIAGGTSAGRVNLTAGQPLTMPLDPARLPARVALSGAGVTGEQLLAIDRSTPTAPRITHPGLRTAGAWQLALDEPAGKRIEMLAVNPDGRESNLTPLPAEKLKQLMGPLEPQVVKFGDETAKFSARGVELWRSVAIALLALVMVETALAAWVGRSR